MTDAFSHGISYTELASGPLNIAPTSTNVIGLVATADDADATAFPLDTAVLVTNIQAALSKAGAGGAGTTLLQALTHIANQTTPILVVVRVAQNADPAEQAALVVGSSAGSRTGMQALLNAQTNWNTKPKILGAPGLDHLAVTTAFAILAQQLRGFHYFRPDATTVADALTYRQHFSAREIMPIWPDFTSGWTGDTVAIAMGKRADIDQNDPNSWAQSLSNQPINGVTGIHPPITFDVMNSNNDAGALNEAQITTLVNLSGGFRFWGNRTCSSDPRFVFEVATRTSQFLHETFGLGLAPYLDKPLTRTLTKDVEDTMNATLRQLTRKGLIIGGTARYDSTANPALSLGAGKVGFTFDFTPCAPAENIGITAAITENYYINLASGLN